MKVIMKPVSVIEAQLGIQNGGPAHKYFTERCYAYMNKYVPYDPQHGGDHLRENVELEVDKIIYNMPYAKIQYYGIIHGKQVPEENYTTEGTGPYWDRQMWSAEKGDLLKEMQDYIRTHGGK